MILPDLACTFEAAFEGMALINGEGVVVLANSMLSSLLGGPVMGRTALELTRSLEAQRVVGRALAGTRSRMELELPLARRTLLLQASPLAPGALLCARDITEAKRMERARRDFVANASHELRTPVSAIAGAAETLLEGGALADPEVAKSFVQMISRNAQRLSELTQDLLDLSRAESGDWRVEISDVQVASAVHSVIELLTPNAKEREIVLSVDVPQTLIARADRQALGQVLVNLVENAIKYTPPKGCVRVDARAEGGTVLIRVTDSGPGIERHHIERLFERFYRAQSGRDRDSGGTGLGLAIVKHLVQAQNGDVGVESSPAGSCFWVRLPAP